MGFRKRIFPSGALEIYCLASGRDLTLTELEIVPIPPVPTIPVVGSIGNGGMIDAGVTATYKSPWDDGKLFTINTGSNPVVDPASRT